MTQDELNKLRNIIIAVLDAADRDCALEENIKVLENAIIWLKVEIQRRDEREQRRAKIVALR